MPKTTLSDLREHLFDVIERLKEGNDPDADIKDSIDINRAKEINHTAQAIINSAKVEVDAWKIIAKESDLDAHLEKSDFLLLNK